MAGGRMPHSSRTLSANIIEIEEFYMCPADPWVRIRLPRGEWFYDPVRLLGPAGGFGEVFEGKNHAGQLVAVKRLKVTAGEAAHRELKIADELAGKSFEHVLAVLDSGEDSERGGYFVVMPRADRSLADELGMRGGATFGRSDRYSQANH
jgi:serine/threonine protein kinase